MIWFVITDLGLIFVVQGSECPKCVSQSSCYKLLNTPWPQQMGRGYRTWLTICLYWRHQQNGEKSNVCIASPACEYHVLIFFVYMYRVSSIYSLCLFSLFLPSHLSAGDAIPQRRRDSVHVEPQHLAQVSQSSAKRGGLSHRRVRLRPGMQKSRHWFPYLTCLIQGFIMI